MATTKCKLKNCRPKAIFGADGAIIATALALQTANDTVNTVMNIKQYKEQANAIRQQARTQSDAIRQQAATQAQVMDRTNDNNTRLAERQIESNKESAKEQSDMLRNISTNLLIAQGQQNTEERRNAAKLVVKKGGNIKRKLRNAAALTKSIHGNLPFVITDGGYANYLGSTPEEFDLYELIGNDHEHYHKTQGGKYKSGVGVKFANGGKPVTVEGEGNQSSSMGELMLVTPNDAMFLSKHSIKGFNPTKAVLAGVSPLKAFLTQEMLKGNNNNPRKGKKASDGLEVYKQQPDYARDNIVNIARALATEDNTGVFENGYNVTNGQMNQIDTSRTNVMRAKKGCSLKRIKAEGGLSKWWGGLNNGEKLGYISLGANTLSAIGNTVGNILGSNWLNSANNYRSEVLGNAYTEAGKIMADAYNRRKGISEDLISKEDFESTPAIATIRTARVNNNADLALIDRQEAAAKRFNNRNTLSSAKRLILNEDAIDKANARRAVSYQNQANQSEQIKQQNAQMLNYVSMQNAEERNRARQAYNNARMEIARYNNDILNENILGAADATSNAALAVAGLQGDTAVANATNRGNAVMNTAATWNNALQTSLGNAINLYGISMGADSDARDNVFKKKSDKLAINTPTYTLGTPNTQFTLKQGWQPPTFTLTKPKSFIMNGKWFNFN